MAAHMLRFFPLKSFSPMRLVFTSRAAASIKLLFTVCSPMNSVSTTFSTSLIAHARRNSADCAKKKSVVAHGGGLPVAEDEGGVTPLPVARFGVPVAGEGEEAHNEH